MADVPGKPLVLRRAEVAVESRGSQDGAMTTPDRQSTGPRYAQAPGSKVHGAIYTPEILADFVAAEIVSSAAPAINGRRMRVLDPAVGDGELLVSLLRQLDGLGHSAVEVHGFETDMDALNTAKERLAKHFGHLPCRIEQDSFLSFVLDRFHGAESLFAGANGTKYDIVIANPPYVRTQVLGAAQAQKLAHLFGLSGRVDLYHAFVLGISRVLADDGVAGVIVSNRFMSTKSGASVRAVLTDRFDIVHAWDLGDTKLFDAAVLPAVLLARGRGTAKRRTRFTSIYETTNVATTTVANPIEALKEEGIVGVEDGRRFVVRHGHLDTSGRSDGVWRIATKSSEDWLATVERCRWRKFGDIGKVRVGVKTCADNVFIGDDWSALSEFGRPELLRPLTTHHVARQYKAAPGQPREILYPHEVVAGCRRAVDLQRYPISQAYLNSHRRTLERRRYVIEAGRAWYELWVPQDPDAWPKPKLVFRDIAEKPAFWLDMTGSVVNGDCYWLKSDKPMDSLAQDEILWLAAAVGNSTFIEQFYDYRFNNKLYAGRRRYATQYVQEFPLPDPHGPLGQAIISKAKEIFENMQPSKDPTIVAELDSMVWQAFELKRPITYRTSP